MNKFTRILVGAVCLYLLVVGRADAQPCGIGELHLAYDSLVQPVENLTIEILKPQSREPFYECRNSDCPAKQTGHGTQTEFIFPTPPGGGRFSLTFFRGRKFHLYAYVDGERGGKLLRYSGQALNVWDGPVRAESYEGDFGPIKIVLDRVEDR